MKGSIQFGGPLTPSDRGLQYKVAFTYIGILQNPGIQHNVIDPVSSLQSDYVAYEPLPKVRQLSVEAV